MSDQEINLTTLKDKLLKGVTQIFKETTISRNYYIELYTDVFDYIKLINDIKYEEKYNFENMSERYKKGQKLYNNINKFLKTHVTNISIQCETHDLKNILAFYCMEWTKYDLSSNILINVFDYYNRTWIICKNKFHNNSHQLLQLCDLTSAVWKSHFVEKFHHKLFNAAYRWIKKERMSKETSSELIVSLVKSYVKIDQKLNLYNDYFVKRYVKKTNKFYISEATKYLNKIEFTEYMIKVHRWLLSESSRADLYLHITTREPLLKVCRKVLIDNHITLFYNKFKQLLHSGKLDNLKFLYNLIINFDKSCLKKFASILEGHIKSEGLLALKECINYAQNDSKLYANTILKVHKKYLTLISTNFHNNDDFKMALHNGFRGIINTSKITKINLNSTELIAKYCDILLKTSYRTRSGGQMNNAIDQAIALIECIEDKNAFQKFYSDLLAQRLLQKLSISNDSEIYIISKITIAHGHEYTRNYEIMIQDLESSKNLNKDFQTLVIASNDPLNLDFNIQVISTYSWPYKKSSFVILPLECEEVMSRFACFYTHKYNKKDLHWLYNLSVGELNTHGYNKKYTITANALQISVLNQYNQSETWTIGQILQNTCIEINAVVEIVQTLLKEKWVICTEATDLNEDSVITINNNYRTKRLHSNINYPQETEIEIKEEQTNVMSEEGKKLLVQAAIIRIIKLKKSIKYKQLTEELLNEVKTKFVPEMVLIKKCIDSLIDGYYIERSETDRETLNYIL